MSDQPADDRAKLLVARASVRGFAKMFEVLIAKTSDHYGREMLATMLAEADQTLAAIDDRIDPSRAHPEESDP